MGDERIIDIVRRAEAGEYDIPEIQRKFVWKREKVSTLCDSIYTNSPIGMILLWDNPGYTEPQVGEVGARRPLWIIDGQQRISSLCILLGRKPNWWNHDDWQDIYRKSRVHLKVPLDSPDEITFGRIQSGERALALPVEAILQEDEEEAMALAMQKVEEAGKPELSHQVMKLVVKLRNLRERTVPVATIGEEKALEQVAEIYKRLNMQGTRVKETDVRLAYIAAYNPGWLRENFYPFMEEREDEEWDIDPGHILQVITIFTTGKARVGQVGIDFWRSGVIDVWNEVKAAIEEALIRLWDCGVTELDLVPSDYTLITLFALCAKFKPDAESFNEAFRWFILANLAGRYGDAPLETLTKDANAIHAATSLDEALAAIHPGFSRDQLRMSLDSVFKKGSPQALLLQILLWRSGARDWFEGISIPTLTRAPKSLEPHWHHILPKGYARRNGYEDAEQVANVTLVCARTNIKGIGSKPPWEYAKGKIPIDVLRDHFFPDKSAAAFYAGKAISPGQFKRFLKERTELLVEAAADYLNLQDGTASQA